VKKKSDIDEESIFLMTSPDLKENTKKVLS